ncbi:hypothetical protein N3K66_007061 [Trichothecium roseum]|uniref:Uncharacterized protein n=1 Tax=Trichothecium roseum TaxID=47278 RepID=A0ACC0UX37_9HYPO|nr:hypothetical protein N3K66_007061 [Trichothecium roseum]
MEPLSRIKAALLLLHAGDSLGASTEFQHHSEIALLDPSSLRRIRGGGIFDWPAGHATDDTDMTRAVLLAYRDLLLPSSSSSTTTTTTPNNEHKTTDGTTTTLDAVQLSAAHFLRWLEGDWPLRTRGQRPVDIGNATLQGLRRYQRTKDPYTSGAGPNQAGNGSLMRCVPTALFRRDDASILRESEGISAVTHNDPRCTASCAAYNILARRLVDGRGPDDALRAAEAVASRLNDEVHQAMLAGRKLDLADLAAGGPPEEQAYSGYVLHSLSLAVAAVLDRRDAVTVMVDIIRIGNDTDTNAAIAGALLGARDGMDAVPQDWRDALQFGDEFEQVAEEIHRLVVAGKT